MNLIQTFKLNDVFIYCMEIDPNQSELMQAVLTATEAERLHNLRHPIKKLEFLGSRFLKHQLFGNQEMYYDSTGAPYLEKQGYISLSHAYPFVVLAVCEDHVVGVDIEPITAKGRRTERRFTTEPEKQALRCTSDEDYTRLWSFKETLYKLSNRNGLLFQSHLIVTPSDSGYVGYTLHTDGFYKTSLDYLKIDGFLITCNTNKPLHVGKHLPSV